MFSVKLYKESDDTKILNRFLLEYNDWTGKLVPRKIPINVVKKRMEKFGVKLVINQRYDKRFHLRAMQFKTEAEYTMFRLKWS